MKKSPWKWLLKTALVMFGVITFSPLILIELISFVLITNAFRTPENPFASFSNGALTNTRKETLKRGDILSIVFDEYSKQPRLLGWQGDILYFADSSGKIFSFDPASDTKIRIQEIPSNLISKKPEPCIGDAPEKYHSYGQSSLEETIAIFRKGCDRYVQKGTTVENWQYLGDKTGKFLTAQRTLVAYKDSSDMQIILGQAVIKAKTVADSTESITLSESGKYVAVTATTCDGLCGFFPTNVYVLDLEKK